ncbi:C2-domain-containing protein [Schizophyllum commune H4-8]|nr:C2-domain-containing protein [Schizophyllum commune H4-8]KAI5899087.1 C2-domain-containing protein [Schizophyllum commune H4-8]
MSRLLHTLHDVAHDARGNAHDLSKVTREFMADKVVDVAYHDLTIQFIGATGLPKMDVVGSADPYFVAKIDDRISFVSSVQVNTLNPVWNEQWHVKNVPLHAHLQVEVLDKDIRTPNDDYIGRIKTTVNPGTKEIEIEAPPLKLRSRGSFWLKIDSEPSTDPNPAEHPYLFAGPIRYSRHCSPTVGAFTNINDARLYSTWKMYLIGVPLFFNGHYQHWNEAYPAAQKIFKGSPLVRTTIQAGHKMLYARSITNGFGIIESAADVKKILQGGGSSRPNTDRGRQFANRIRPAVYTYIISSDDDSFRFSETGAAFFVDVASKHALHANCSETVRYSGEFHPRPKGGWQNFHDDIADDDVDWELVIDNNSGTYAPDKNLLPQLRALLKHNFPWFEIYALDRDDPELAKSREACRDYALKFRGVGSDELEPHVMEGEVSLHHQASASATTSKCG